MRREGRKEAPQRGKLQLRLQVQVRAAREFSCAPTSRLPLAPAVVPLESLQQQLHRTRTCTCLPALWSLCSCRRNHNRRKSRQVQRDLIISCETGCRAASPARGLTVDGLGGEVRSGGLRKGPRPCALQRRSAVPQRSGPEGTGQQTGDTEKRERGHASDFPFCEPSRASRLPRSVIDDPPATSFAGRAGNKKKDQRRT